MPLPDPAARHLGRRQEYLKQIVYGGNDGIVTTFAIVAGFAGASAEGVVELGTLAVLVFGLANLFADAVSMGLGEFLSARSKRDLYRSEFATMLARVSGHRPAAEASLGAVFRARGFPPEAADTIGAQMARNPAVAAEIMLAFETDLTDPSRERPAMNGFVTFLAFVIFGVVPLVPYLALPATDGTFWLSVAATVTSLVGLGLLRWSATGENLARSVGETVTVGGVCALVAFAVGWIVGAM
jgi:VIT1/CCC1 family predicted Fe2+/Mn2+ transporter